MDRNHLYDYSVAVALRGINPKENKLNVYINNNSYCVFDTLQYTNGKHINTNSAYIRFIELDKYGRLLDDGGTSTEYNTLRNWYNWTAADKNSVTYNFKKDMDTTRYNFTPDSDGRYLINRMHKDIQQTISQLERGRIIPYVTTDIDNTDKLSTGKSFNIGAIEFPSSRLMSDFEVASITSPGAYRNKFPQEQIMLTKRATGQPNVVVKALVRNNGRVHMANVPVVCRITQGTSLTVEQTLIVNLAVGEEREIEFFATSSPRFTPQPYQNSTPLYPTM